MAGCVDKGMVTDLDGVESYVYCTEHLGALLSMTIVYVQVASTMSYCNGGNVRNIEFHELQIYFHKDVSVITHL